MRLKAGKTDKNRKKTTGFENADIENSRKNNREFTVITYAVLVLFVCMMGYFAYFQFVKVKILSIVLIIKDRIFLQGR